jgi:hypothetical protein
VSHTHDTDAAETAAHRLNNYIRAAGINGTGSVEETDDGMRLRATLYEPSEDDIIVMRRVPRVDGIDVRILIIR